MYKSNTNKDNKYSKNAKLKKEDSEKNDSKSSSLKKALIAGGLSLFSNDLNNTNLSSSDDIITVLESEYKDSLFSDDEVLKNNYLKSSSTLTNDNKNTTIHHNNSNEVNSTKNYEKSSYFLKYYVPNKNKCKVNMKYLNEIINTLKGDYMSITELFQTFQKYDFSSIDNVKSNKILNDLESKVFNRYRSFNNISRIINSNIELKNTLSSICKAEDIASQCAMYAYNIYSFIKIFHYKKNNNIGSKSLKKHTYSSSNNQKNSKFKKEEFDPLKSSRDEEIKILQNKSTDNISSEEYSNLNTLRNDRSIMEGYKSNLRLNTIQKTRTEDLSNDIRNSKKSIDKLIFNAPIMSFNNLNKLSLNGFNLVKMYKNLQK
ncbi:Uncharacterised protein [Clostridium carnis]|uniref:Uncharacterized protein n=1 Tax=Clostridium carnis TaxID=1530 RepID=A0ABY6SNS7_9CLOT|nr:hypothetical protein [Clostridium carnis]VDG69797.1 Uncharacterised protein [Clostridium carnis]